MAVNLTACALLILQYLLGMVANLFVTLPAHHPGAGAHNYFAGIAAGVGWVIPSGPAWVAAHVTLGLALAAGGLANAAWAARLHRPAYTATSTLGFLAILGAAFNGASFLSYGHNVSSMIMAGLWALAIASYLTGLILAAGFGRVGTRVTRESVGS